MNSLVELFVYRLSCKLAPKQYYKPAIIKSNRFFCETNFKNNRILFNLLMVFYVLVFQDKDPFAYPPTPLFFSPVSCELVNLIQCYNPNSVWK